MPTVTKPAGAVGLNSSMQNHLFTPPVWIAALEVFAMWMRAADRPDSTIYQYLYRLRRLARHAGKDPFDLDTEDLVAFLGSRTWSPNTRRGLRSAVRSFYDFAHATGRMTTNIGAGLPGINAPLGVPRPAPEDAIAVGRQDVDPRVRLMILLGAQAGLRCCEIAAVHTRDLEQDLVGWSLRVLGKGRKTRLVPLNDELAVTLRRLEPGFLFPGAIDGHLSASYVSKLISNALPAGWTAHTLRHRFGSVAYAKGGRDLRAVQILLGHSSVATTQIYVAVPNDALRVAVDAAA